MASTAPAPTAVPRRSVNATDLDEDLAILRIVAPLTPQQRIGRWTTVARSVAQSLGGIETSALVCQVRFEHMIQKYAHERARGNGTWPAHPELRLLLARALATKTPAKAAKVTPPASGSSTPLVAKSVSATAQVTSNVAATRAGVPPPTSVAHVAAAALNAARFKAAPTPAPSTATRVATAPTPAPATVATPPVAAKAMTQTVSVSTWPSASRNGSHQSAVQASTATSGHTPVVSAMPVPSPVTSTPSTSTAPNATTVVAAPSASRKRRADEAEDESGTTTKTLTTMLDRLVAMEDARLEDAREERAYKKQQLEMDQLKYQLEKQQREREEGKQRELRLQQDARRNRELAVLRASLTQAQEAIERQQKTIEELQNIVTQRQTHEQTQADEFKQQVLARDEEIAMLRVAIQTERDERVEGFKSMMDTIKLALAGDGDDDED